MASANSLRLGSGFFLLLVPIGLLVGGCSALLEPDINRLGAGVDGGLPPDVDAGPGIDAGPRPDGAPALDAGGVDAGRFVDAGRRPDTGPIGPVDAGCATRCQGGMLYSCTGQVPCPLGCSPGGEARCAQMIPSNVDPSLFDESLGDVIIGEGARFVLDTSRCQAESAELAVFTQSDGSEVCVVRTHNFILESRARLRVVGSRPLIVLATGDFRVSVGAILNASAFGIAAGPGGGLGGNGQRPRGTGESPGNHGTHEGSFDDGGGGGGAFCGRGGAGGEGGEAAGAERAQAIDSNLLVPLRGGSGGGLGMADRLPIGIGNGGAGGAGGGALQVSALGTLEVQGWITAGGGSGLGGGRDEAFPNWGAGGGGGSGGGILLEAPNVIVGAGAIISASGGGGAGSASTRAAGENGRDGHALLQSADGGDAGGTLYGAAGGSSGGGADEDGRSGQSNTNDLANGGGGGGGGGCVVLRSFSTLSPSTRSRISPNGEPGLQASTILLR